MSDAACGNNVVGVVQNFVLLVKICFSGTARLTLYPLASIRHRTVGALAWGSEVIRLLCSSYLQVSYTLQF